MDIVITRQHDGGFTYTRDSGMAKSQASRDGLVAVPCVRLAQRGRSEMSPEQRYINGNAFIGMVPEPSTLFCAPETRAAIRKALAESGNAAALFDAGRLDEGAIVKAVGAAEGDQRDQEGNLIVGEPLRKGEEETIFGERPSLLTKGGGAAIVRKAFAGYMDAIDDGSPASQASIQGAARELDEMVKRFEGGR